MEQNSTRPNYWIARMSNLDDNWLEKVRTKGDCMFVAEYRYGKNEAGMEGRERGRKRADIKRFLKAANFSRGIVLFKDSDVFYENLEEDNNWGQRIDVDDWHCYLEDTSVTTEELNPIRAIRQNTLFMIDPNDGKKKKKELEEQYGSRRI